MSNSACATLKNPAGNGTTFETSRASVHQPLHSGHWCQGHLNTSCVQWTGQRLVTGRGKESNRRAQLTRKLTLLIVVILSEAKLEGAARRVTANLARLAHHLYQEILRDSLEGRRQLGCVGRGDVRADWQRGVVGCRMGIIGNLREETLIDVAAQAD